MFFNSECLKFLLCRKRKTWPSQKGLGRPLHQCWSMELHFWIVKYVFTYGSNCRYDACDVVVKMGWWFTASTGVSVERA